MFRRWGDPPPIGAGNEPPALRHPQHLSLGPAAQVARARSPGAAVRAGDDVGEFQRLRPMGRARPPRPGFRIDRARTSFHDAPMSRIHLPLALIAFASAVSSPAADGVQMTQGPDKVRVEINGELFTEYCFTGAPHVYYFPLLGPGGTRLNRNWPMTETAGEERDHPHHRSLWYSHGAVNGVDFWAETPKAGKIVHDRFLEVKGGRESGVIRSANNWIAPDGTIKLT